MSFAKKGQAAAGAAVLVFIIAGLLVLFILAIPAEDRAEILGEDVKSSSSSSSSSSSDSDSDEFEDLVAEEELFVISPGRIDYLAQKEVEHPLPAVSIFTTTDTTTIAEKNVAYAKKGVFSEEVSTFSFSLSDVENTENVLLGLHVDAVKGGLVVLLNDEEVFRSEVAVGPLAPISLPVNSLAEENVITIAAISPGLAFWRTHEITTSNLVVVADVTSFDSQSSKSLFLVSDTEKKNLDTVKLKFQPNCVFSKVGKLTVSVNGNVVYQAVPDCGEVMVPLELDPDVIEEGENEVVFHTEEGTYLLSNVVVESDLKDVEFPTYFFDIEHEQFEDVQDEELRVRLQLDFVDVVVSKRGDVVFNGHVESFDTKEVQLTFDLSEDIVQGVNALKIKPKKTLEVRELRVELVES